jgi:pimeloyl-ACP methyl ester carboxylesterase
MTEPALEKTWRPTAFGRVAYVETGRPDAPPLLFVHGIPTSASSSPCTSVRAGAVRRARAGPGARR